jgi:hypothetical protein
MPLGSYGVYVYDPPVPSSDTRPLNPFHNGLKSFRDGDWKIRGTLPALVAAYGAMGFIVRVGQLALMGGRAPMPVGCESRSCQRRLCVLLFGWGLLRGLVGGTGGDQNDGT